MLSIEEKMRQLSDFQLDDLGPCGVPKLKQVKKASLPDIKKNTLKYKKQNSLSESKKVPEKRQNYSSDLLDLGDFSGEKIKSEMDKENGKVQDNLLNDLFFAGADEDSVSSGYHSTKDDQAGSKSKLDL